MSTYQEVDPSYMQAGAAKLMPSVKPCPPPSPAVALIDQLRLAQNETHGLLGDLESRLAFVLRAVDTKEAMGESSKPGYDSPILSELSNRVDVEGNIQARLRLILNGLVI